MPQNKFYHTQSGNVFIIILIAVFLFGALMFTFSRSGSQGVSSISKQEAKIAAQEILNYARLVESAVDRVRRNGCSESEISFENAIVAGYTNPNSPADKSCHVFDDAGGKITTLRQTEQWLDRTYEGSTSYGNFVYTGNIRVIDIGSTKTELSFYLPYISKEVCENINNLIKVDNPLPQDAVGGGVGLFTGTYTPAVTPDIGNEATQLAGKSTFCIQVGTAWNLFYHVLLAR
jgi:hypothetical protein